MSSHSFNALLLSALLVAACAHPEQAPPRATVDAPVVAAKRTSLPAFHSVAGTVRSQTASTLAANVVGTVVRVLVAEGDRVHAGDLLVEIDARGPRAQADRARAGGEEVERAIDAASANAKLAETTYQRYAALRERGSASPQELDEVRARQTAAQAELARLVARRGEARAESAQAAAVLGYSSVRAPIDGIVTARFADPGAQAAPGVPLIAIEDERAARVDANVPENVSVRVGDYAFVDAGNARFNARVARVQPSVDTGARSALVKLELDQPLRSGTFVNVSFPIGERSAVTVPLRAVVRRGQLASVFVVGADHVARMRLITLGEIGGAFDGEQAEVLSGLDAGESIVTTPARVREGVIVRSGP
jgi:RND family efflux transporter MFP subunit